MIAILLILTVSTLTFALTLASFAWEDLLVGFVLSTVLLLLFRNVLLPERLPRNRQVIKAIVVFPVFVLVAIRDVFVGTWLVALIVLGIRKLEHPGIVRVPLGRRSKPSAGLAGLVLTLSPGTFLVAMDWEAREMLVHAIDASDPDKLRENYDTFYERYEQHVVP
ncbi:MAG TPA: Na+/H+ antiporter subunit E [Thermomicrobiales bacterium]|nr:Na+/H+ antiporter subunit E [Thermomicrobiales bacterium]